MLEETLRGLQDGIEESTNQVAGGEFNEARKTFEAYATPEITIPPEFQQLYSQLKQEAKQLVRHFRQVSNGLYQRFTILAAFHGRNFSIIRSIMTTLSATDSVTRMAAQRGIQIAHQMNSKSVYLNYTYIVGWRRLAGDRVNNAKTDLEDEKIELSKMVDLLSNLDDLRQQAVDALQPAKNKKSKWIKWVGRTTAVFALVDGGASAATFAAVTAIAGEVGGEMAKVDSNTSEIKNALNRIHSAISTTKANKEVAEGKVKSAEDKLEKEKGQYKKLQELENAFGKLAASTEGLKMNMRYVPNLLGRLTAHISRAVELSDVEAFGRIAAQSRLMEDACNDFHGNLSRWLGD